jgi:hypothetical protein
MVGASDVDSSSANSTSSSSSSEDEGDRRKGRKLSKNLSGLSCFARDGFCTMALSSGSKKSTQSDSDSDDKVRDELPFLRQENEWLGLLLDNRDDMLREAKKMRKELRASLEELDVLRVEVVELKSRPALLGACTSCPVLHGKINEMHAYIFSLEAKSKEPIPTSCSTCELPWPSSCAICGWEVVCPCCGGLLLSVCVGVLSLGKREDV